MNDEVTARPADRDACHQRAEVPPVWTGDLLDGECIVGFTLTRDPGPADQVLVDGDENLAAPPYRPLPVPGDLPGRLKRTGPPPDDAPAAGLSSERVSPETASSETVSPETAQRVGEGLEQQLQAMGEAGDFIRKVLEHIAAEDHRVWLVGGAVRDLIAQRTARPADLDFTGTIGPGELYDAMRRWRRAEGMADYRPFISPQLVCAVCPPGGSRPDAFLEYKPLSQPGFRFPAWGGTLARDAATRDLTINALYYDHGDRVVADPTGRGVTDLQATRPIAATPYCGDDPVEQAAVILRSLKFRLRWPDLDVSEISAWAAGLPQDLVTRIPAARWAFLAGLRGRCIPERHRGEDELKAAREIGLVALRLVERLHAVEKAGA